MILISEEKTKKLPGLTSLFVSFDYNPLIVDILKEFDIKVYDKNTKVWEFNLNSLQELIDKLSAIDDIKLKFKKDPPDIDLNSIILNKHKTNPYPYQAEGIKYGISKNRWLLLDPCGLGKTLQAIELAEELKIRDNISHCLIICGINSLKSNWKKEIEKHSFLNSVILGSRITKKGKLVIGSVKDREAHLRSKIDEFFIITNVETLRQDCIIKAIEDGPNNIDMIVFDEMHVCKSPTSGQGKNILKLKKSKYKVGMTGTILLNKPLDAYVPLKWIGEERSNYTTFKYHYCIYSGKFKNIITGYRNLNILKDQLNKVSLRRSIDILQLPAKNIIVENLDMDDKQAKFYENITDGIVSEVDKVHISTTSLLAMVSRLRQATACPSILTTEDIPSVKIERACELAEQIVDNGDKVVIFSTFKQTVEELRKKLISYKPIIATGDTPDSDISNNIDDFQNNPDTKIFIGTWQKCGTGITLTAASYMIFIDTPWTDGVFQQACDRIYRIGTKKPVFIYNLICKNTIDERVLEIISDKQALSDYIVDDKLSERSVSILQKYIQNLF